jgi:hypothetical protein
MLVFKHCLHFSKRAVPFSIIISMVHPQLHRYQKSLNRLLKVSYVPAASAVLIAFFLLFLLRPLTELMKQTRQPVHAIKQSIYLDVYPQLPLLNKLFKVNVFKV